MPCCRESWRSYRRADERALEGNCYNVVPFHFYFQPKTRPKTRASCQPHLDFQELQMFVVLPCIGLLNMCSSCKRPVKLWTDFLLLNRLINDPPVATLQNVVGPSTSLRGDIIVVTAATSTVPSTADSPFPSTKTRDSILMAYPRELATPATGTIKNGTLSAALGESTAATAIKMTDRRKIFLLHGLYQAETLAGSPRASLAEIQSRMWAACPRTGHGARFEPLTDTEAFFFTPRLRDGGCLHPVCGRGVYCCNNVGRSGRSMLLLSAPVDRWQGVCRCMRISRRGWPTLAGGWESHQPCPSFFMTVRLHYYYYYLRHTHRYLGWWYSTTTTARPATRIY